MLTQMQTDRWQVIAYMDRQIDAWTEIRMVDPRTDGKTEGISIDKLMGKGSLDGQTGRWQIYG